MTEADDERGFSPDVAIAPGATIRETIDALGMPQKELALRMGRPVTKINELLQGRIAITPETATQLERVLGAPAGFWLRLEMDYRTTLERVKPVVGAR